MKLRGKLQVAPEDNPNEDAAASCTLVGLN